MAKKKLSVRDLFILERFDGREVGYKIPEYELEEFGRDAADRVNCLIEGGYLTYAEPKIALNVLTIPQLKEILRANGKKLSGKKDDLIARIIETCTNYDVPKVYTATAKGINELETRDYFFENKRNFYDFLNAEIESAEGDGVNPLEKLFSRDMIKHVRAQNYSSLAYTYEKYGKYLQNHEREDEALTAYLTAAYLQLTGMGDYSVIVDYKDLFYVFDEGIWREIDDLKTALNFSDAKLESVHTMENRK